MADGLLIDQKALKNDIAADFESRLNWSIGERCRYYGLLSKIS